VIFPEYEPKTKKLGICTRLVIVIVCRPFVTSPTTVRYDPGEWRMELQNN
jgi:hypothetical protein